jgi:hypothetical protein
VPVPVPGLLGVGVGVLDFVVVGVLLGVFVVVVALARIAWAAGTRSGIVVAAPAAGMDAAATAIAATPTAVLTMALYARRDRGMPTFDAEPNLNTVSPTSSSTRGDRS